MRVWLDDDDRDIRDGFDVRVATAQGCIDILRHNRVTFISLDHDLGAPENGTGYDVAKYIDRMVRAGIIEMPEVQFHTANPVGRKNMQELLAGTMRFLREQESV